MTLKVRSLSDEEREILAHWQRSDNVVGYRRSRIVHLSATGWGCTEIAKSLGLHIESMRQIANDFNLRRCKCDCPPAPFGGSVRPVIYSVGVVEVAADLVRQGPPAEQELATWTLAGLGRAIADRFEHLSQVSHETVRRLLAQHEIIYRQAKEW